MQFVKELVEGSLHKNILFSYYVSDVEIQRDDVHCLKLSSFFGSTSPHRGHETLTFYVIQNLEKAVDMKIMSVIT